MVKLKKLQLTVTAAKSKTVKIKIIAKLLSQKMR